MQTPPQEILDRWDLTRPILIAETSAARVWKVTTADGLQAALKLYHRPDRGNEGPGTALLRAWQNRGAVEILAEVEKAVLMEWLDGRTLGDVARAGRPKAALSILAETASRLHQTPKAVVGGLTPLRDVFAPFFDCRFDPSCPDPLRHAMTHAIALAARLLDQRITSVPLHGDLHPDNVILTDAGPRVIDAKGYLGDPAFELANAVRHPKGLPDMVRQPQQISRSLTLYADALGVPRKRLAQWAAAKSALSIFWRANGPVTNDDEADLLELFLQAADQ